MQAEPQVSSLVVEAVQIPAKEIGAKFRSKREIYRFLTAEVKCYLGDFETMTIWHLRDLAAGDR